MADAVWGLCLSADGTLWASTMFGLYSFSPEQKAFTPVYIDQKKAHDGLFISKYSEVKPGQLWLGSGAGLGIFNVSSNKMQYIAGDSARADRPAADRVWSVYQSRDGMVWLATANGVDRLKPGNATVSHIQRIPGSENTLTGNMVTALQEDREGRIWVGTERGLHLYRPETGALTFIDLPWPGAGTASQVEVKDISSDQQGNLWVASMGGVIRLNPATGDSVPYSTTAPPNRRLKVNYCVSLASDKAGNMWLAFKNGELSYVNPSGELIHLSSSGDSQVKLGWVVSITPDIDGKLWFAMDDGMAIFDPAGKTVQRCKFNPNDPASLKGSFVSGIFQDHTGRIWAATDQGLEEVDRSGKRIKTISQDDGLPSNLVTSIEEDDYGKLWLGTDQGMIRYDPAQGRVLRYTPAASVQRLHFLPHASLKSKSGKLFFGSTRGLIHFDPGSVSKDVPVPDIKFTDLQVNNVSLKPGSPPLQKSVTLTRSVSLDHTQNALAIKFSALIYSAPQMVQYSYRLQGLDHNWNQTGAEEPQASYPHLEPGSYWFQVRARVGAGPWSPRQAELGITILPPWWNTLWFRILAGTVLILLLAAAYLGRVASLKRQSRRLNSQVASRTRDLEISQTRYRELYQIVEMEKKRVEEALEVEREAIKQNRDFIDMLSHEYRTPLSVLSSCLDLLEDEPLMHKVPDASEQLAIMRKSTTRMRNIFDYSLHQDRVGDIGDHIDMNDVDLARLIALSCDYVGSVYPDQTVRLINESADAIKVNADADLMGTAINNLLDNACKYSNPNGIVTVTLKAQKDFVQILIEDSGTGINKGDLKHVMEKYYRSQAVGNRAGAGLGLYLVKRIIELHNGEIVIHSKLGEGTKVIIRLSHS